MSGFTQLLANPPSPNPRFLTGMYPGPPAPATLIMTGLNWDAPNVWPPHVYTGIKALETILRINPNSSVVSNISLSDFSQIPTGQLGLNQSQLPVQPASVLGNDTTAFKQSIEQMQKGQPWPNCRWRGGLVGEHIKLIGCFSFSLGHRTSQPIFAVRLLLMVFYRWFHPWPSPTAFG